MNPEITSALGTLGEYVVGLRVLYRGFGMSVYPPDKSTGGLWLAYAHPDAEDDGYPLEVTGSGSTPMEAMEACFKECEAAEAL